MKIAYLLMAHKDPELIRRLVASLEDSGDFFIHIDKKTDIQQFRDALDGYSHVFWADNRIKVNWAAWSMTEVYLLLLKQAFESKNNYDRFVFLTGQDYPLMSNKQIVTEFCNNPDVEYIMAYKISTSTIPTDKNKVLKKWYFENPFNNRFLRRCWYSFTYRVLTRLSNRGTTTVPLNGECVESYFGQMLSAFTRKGAELLLSVFENDKEYNKVMKHVHASVEHYWHTIIFNSPLRMKTIQNGEEHEITEHFGWAPLHYHTYIDDTSVFYAADFDVLINSGYMFCRKVMSDKSKELLDKIDEYRTQEDS